MEGVVWKGDDDVELEDGGIFKASGCMEQDAVRGH